VSEHPNVAKVHALAEAFGRGDLDTVVGGYADDAVYRVGGDNVVSGSYRGHQEIRDFFIRLGEVTGGSMRFELEDALADDRHAVMIWRLSAERNGNSLDATGAMAFKIGEDGRFTESWFLYNDQRAYDEFYS
jgi:ketosteroid isomerase-like protein